LFFDSLKFCTKSTSIIQVPVFDIFMMNGCLQLLKRFPQIPTGTKIEFHVPSILYGIITGTVRYLSNAIIPAAGPDLRAFK
jgi:hypothetical protein